MQALLDLVLPFETWVVLPVLGLAALALTVVLRGPQLTQIVEGWRGLRGDPSAPGDLTAGGALALSVAATAAGSLVATGTAISLGGMGAVAWVWLFGLVVAPLRYGETLLSRSAPPGKAGIAGSTGSLTARLAGDPASWLSTIGVALGLLVPVAAFAVVGGVHGTQLAEAADALLPGSGLYLAIAAAVAGVALVLVPAARPALGWIGLAAVLTLVVALILPITQNLGRAFSFFPRAFDDALHGSAAAGAFTGALVGEIARAALQHLLPAIASTVGADGAIQAAAKASSARTQAASATLGALGHVVIVSLVGMAISATGTLSRRTDDDSRLLSEVTWVDTAYETASQRLEHERRWTGYLRIVDGAMEGTPREVGIERSMIASPRFSNLDGTPADIALRVADGRVRAVLRPDEDGALAETPDDETTRVLVTGSMLPRGARLLYAAEERGAGDVGGRLLLAALVLLMALGVAGWGLAAQGALTRDLGSSNARLGVVVAGAGLVVGAAGVAPFLPQLGAIVGGTVSLLGAIGILAKLRELDRMLTPPKPVEATKAAKPATKPTAAAAKKRR